MVNVCASPLYTLILSMLVIPALFILAGIISHGMQDLTTAYTDEQGAFYQVVSHGTMVLGFGLVGLFVIVAFGAGWKRFRLDTTVGRHEPVKWRDVRQALGDSLRLRYLGSSGEGCTYPDARPSMLRRLFHHFTFYGFLLCFAATSVATVYHYLFGWPAPYPFLSLPVILGTLGGIGLIIGPLGLLALKKVRDAEPSETFQTRADTTLLALLLMISITGFLLLLFRETPAMGIVLLVHLGLVMGLFLTMPYGKFVHGLYRFGALIRHAKEERES
jgi:citrate/tricarballylate utilization protein